MQAIQRAQPFIPQEEYLAAERTSQEKREWYHGECFAMAGETRWHNLLSGKMYTTLTQHLSDKPCTSYMADFRLFIESHQPGTWEYERLTQRSERFMLESIDYRLSLEDLYRDIVIKKPERQKV